MFKFFTIGILDKINNNYLDKKIEYKKPNVVVLGNGWSGYNFSKKLNFVFL